jgi:N-succinyldiaminopimelate aminotransferase
MARFPALSTTTDNLSHGVFSELVKRAAARAGGVHPLHVGDTYLDPIEGARAEAQLTAEHPRLHNYAPVQGEPVLLDAVVERLELRVGRAVDRRQIQIMSGATSGLSIACNTVLDPGDEVLLPAPFWPLIRGIIESRGARPVQIPFYDRVSEGGFDAERALEAAVTDRTTAIYVNTPNNPTGCILPPDTVDAIAAVARRHRLWVLCDEAYEEIWFGPERPAPVWDREDLRDRAIASHTLSKSYGLAGARVGFTHGPATAMERIRGLQTFQTYCAARPLQLGAARALREGDAWLERARALYADAARRTAEAFGVDPPEGGTFLFVDAARHFREDESLMQFLERCLDAGVLLTPGTASGADYATWVRVCFTSVPPPDLEDALERLTPILTR